ncbi:hypothetical protein CsatB_001966 [Cannabis sativa]
MEASNETTILTTPTTPITVTPITPVIDIPTPTTPTIIITPSTTTPTTPTTPTTETIPAVTISTSTTSISKDAAPLCHYTPRIHSNITPVPASIDNESSLVKPDTITTITTSDITTNTSLNIKTNLIPTITNTNITPSNTNNTLTLNTNTTPIDLDTSLTNDTTKAKKKTKGRQKIEMKMIKEEENRLITFSKRRSGIYKKACELVTLCGAEVGVVIFSPSGKPFSYGSPSIDDVASRFLPSQTDTQTSPIVEAQYRRVRINELNEHYNNMSNNLDAEKETLKEHKKMTAEGSTPRAIDVAPNLPKGWWDAPVDGLSLDELKQLHKNLEELHAKMVKQGLINRSGTNQELINSLMNFVEHQSATGIHASCDSHVI